MDGRRMQKALKEEGKNPIKQLHCENWECEVRHLTAGNGGWDCTCQSQGYCLDSPVVLDRCRRLGTPCLLNAPPQETMMMMMMMLMMMYN